MDVLDVEERQLVLPVETGRGHRRVGQPIERDVVEDVVARKAFGFPVEDAGDELVAARVMVEDPGGEADRQIRDARTASAAGLPSPARSPGHACRRSRAGRRRPARRPNTIVQTLQNHRIWPDVPGWPLPVPES